MRNEAASVRVWKRVVQVASGQWGVVENRQLWRCGASRTTVARWTAGGRLYRRHRNVYAVGRPVLPVEGELAAALFFAGPGATLSHGTAAWWWGLIDEPPRLIHISVPGHRRSTEGVCIHNRRNLDRVWHRRLPVTTVGQTLLDFASTAPLEEVRRALAETEFKAVTELWEVEAALRRGRPGSATLRAALHRHKPELARTRSGLERRFLLLCESAGVPTPEINVMFHGYLIDALWREQRVAVELDGLPGHRTRAQLENNHQRDLVLRSHGFVVHRYTWQQVTRHAAAVQSDLIAALARDGS
jgi:predicted transcriptional regulator of viral defense system